LLPIKVGAEIEMTPVGGVQGLFSDLRGNLGDFPLLSLSVFLFAFDRGGGKRSMMGMATKFGLG